MNIKYEPHRLDRGAKTLVPLFVGNEVSKYYLAMWVGSMTLEYVSYIPWVPHTK